MFTNVQIQAACSDYNGDRKTCQADTSCLWDPSSKICSDAPSANRPPVANAGPNQTVGRSSSVTLDGSSSSDPDSDPLTYTWTLTSIPSGSTATLSGAATVNPTFTADLDGTYVVSLIVNDGTVDSAADSVTITAQNTKPVANAGNNQNVLTASLVTLDGSGSSDANGDALTYSWSFTSLPSGSTATLSIPTAEEPTFTADVVGDYVLQLIVNDGTVNSDPDSVIITASAVPVIEADLEITKTATQSSSIISTLEISSTFEYSIAVENLGPDAAQNIVVTDNLPDDIILDSIAATTDWTCVDNSGDISCTHNGDLSVGSAEVIILNVTASATEGTITNEANVSSDNDPDTSNNSSSVNVIIYDPSVFSDLCYSNITETGNKCEQVGNFYYGENNPHTCLTTTDIANQNTVDPLTSVIVYKVYTPGLDNGSCATSAGSCNGPTTITTSAGVAEGYSYDLGTMAVNAFETISDTNSWDSGADVSDIALYGQYQKNGITYSGEILACSGGGLASAADKSDIITPLPGVTFNATEYNSGAQKYITTKVAADTPVTLTGVHINPTTLEAVNYAPSVGDSSWNFTIIPFLSNGTCTSMEPVIDPNTNMQLLIDIPYGSTVATGEMTVSPTVSQDSRFQMIVIDLQTLSAAGQQCILSSSTTGNFLRISQCANSEHQYVTAFGQNTWDRCGEDSGKPCVSRNHGDADTSDPTYDPATDAIYDNELGCYICTFNITPDCSTDNFAIRPERFDMGMSDNDAPNLLRAGEEYGVSLTARDAVNTIPAAYTITDNFNDDLDSNTTRYFKDGTEDTSGLLHGTSDLNRSTTAYMVEGLSSLSTTKPANAQEIIDISYDDVGLVELKVYDPIWSAVDNDDTPMDCNSTVHTYICGESNVTFIPHHFGFSELNITNHAGPTSNFTYIADKRGMPSTSLPIRSPMAARVQTRIEALTKNGNITQNFKTDATATPYNPTLYYENPIDVTMVVTVPSTGTNMYIYPDANESNITNSYIGFGRTGVDHNGTRNILWDESDFPLEFNFQREINEPANPFDVNGSHFISIKIISNYTDIDDGNTAEINGTRISDGSTGASIAACATDEGCIQENAENNATFYYGRTRASKYFYDDITTDSVITPIFIDVYCDLGFTACDSFGINTTEGQTNEYKWWLSWYHNESNGDGNITLEVGTITPSTGTGSASVDTDVTITSEGKDDTINVRYGSGTKPMIVEIDLDDTPSTNTNHWLIYNPDDAINTPTPFYKVQFKGTSGWAGHGQTGYVVDSNASTKKNRRLGW